MATRTRKPAASQKSQSTVAVLYDPSSGEVLHGVTISAEDGASPPPAAEAERLARECAEIGEGLKKAAVLLVAGQDFDRSAALKVDVKSRKLVRLPELTPPSRRIIHRLQMVTRMM